VKFAGQEEASDSEMLDLATSDPLLMHTLILLAGSHWVRLGGNQVAVALSLAYHNVEGLRMINERCGNPKSATMDGTVAAVAVMALSEVTRPN
jgi:hypothetical protein